jgi:hypothetical protein
MVPSARHRVLSITALKPGRARGRGRDPLLLEALDRLPADSVAERAADDFGSLEAERPPEAVDLSQGLNIPDIFRR